MPSPRIKFPKVTIKDVLYEYFRAARPRLWAYIAAVIFVIASTIVGGVVTPLFYKNFFDVLSKGIAYVGASSELVHIILWILILHAISLALYRGYTLIIVFLHSSDMASLRQNSFDYLIGHSYEFFSNSFSGALVQKINRFSRSFERVSDRLFGDIIPILTRVVGVSIVLWLTQPIFTYAIIVWMIVYGIIAYIFSQWKRPYDIKAAAAESKASGVLADSIANSATIQLFSRDAHESALFGAVNTEHKVSLARKWRVAEFIDIMQAVINIVVEFIIFYVAIHYWSVGLFTVGTFVLIQIYILGLMDSFWGFGRILRDLYEAFGDAKEMVEILKLSHGIQNAVGAQPLKVPQGKIDLNAVRFAFNPTNPVLDGIDLNVKAGERVALIGPSGAGKSTLVRLLLRLYDLQSGSITIDGQDISKVTQGSLRENISFVPQDPILFHRSLKDNIKYGRTDATDEQVIEAAKLAHCHEFITSFPQGYDTFVGERGVKLSGGERQRVAIARAILKNAPILILDEATSSLDSHSEVLIQDALENLMKGKTVMVIAHRLSTIRKMNRIIVLEHGKIIEQGTHDELLEKNGLYAKLWSLQSHGFIKEEGEEAETK